MAVNINHHHNVCDVHDVITAPDGSDSELIVFKDTRSVQEALLLDCTNMRDPVISVSVPSKSQLVLLSDRDLVLADISKVVELDTFRELLEN